MFFAVATFLKVSTFVIYVALESIIASRVLISAIQLDRVSMLALSCHYSFNLNIPCLF